MRQLTKDTPSRRTIAQKMGIRQNDRAIFVNADSKVMNNIALPLFDIPSTMEEQFDYIHLFVKTQTELKLARRAPIVLIRSPFFSEIKYYLKTPEAAGILPRPAG